MLYNEDCIKVMKSLKEKAIDLVFANPPYFLSNGGLSIKSGEIVSVNKGEWDKKENYADADKFTFDWLFECYRILKNSGTIWVSGTYHNIFDIEKTMKRIGFKIINIVVWHKSDPPPLIYKNKFRFSYEFVIWAKKGGQYTFNYELMKEVDKKEMEDVWTIPAVQNNEKAFGYHPTQKPERLLRRIVASSSNKGDVVLDPFMGSGTTCYVAKKMGRNYVGIEKDEKYFSIAKRRIESIK